jgi:hypothetical protein
VVVLMDDRFPAPRSGPCCRHGGGWSEPQELQPWSGSSGNTADALAPLQRYLLARLFLARPTG